MNKKIVETPSEKKAYFFSDAHLGIPDHASSLKREKIMVNFLESIKHDALEIYMMGDLFDFWFEYKTCIPKGYARLFGKLAEITDAGIPIFFFRGNHDIWAFDYLKEELNICIERKPQIKQILGKTFYLAHGDGLGNGDHGYKFLKKVFEFKLNQWLFRWLHPDLGLRMGLFFSRRSRYANEMKDHKMRKEKLYKPIQETRLPQFAKTVLEQDKTIDFFVMGHYHVMKDIDLSSGSRFIFLGDWINRFSYGEFDGKDFRLKQFKSIPSP